MSGEVTGIDVGDQQGQIDFASLRRTGALFAFIDCTDGVPGKGFATPARFFKVNYNGAKQAGVTRGPIHTFRPNVDPFAQVEHHLTTVAAIAPGDMPSAVRIITDATIPPKYQDPAWFGPILADFLRQLVHVLPDRRPLVFAAPDVWSQLVLQSDYEAIASIADLWIAAPTPAPVGAWTSSTFWQESSRAGGAVGHDSFNGSLQTFEAYIKTPQVGPPAPGPGPSPGPSPPPRPRPTPSPGPTPGPRPSPPSPPTPASGGGLLDSPIALLLIVLFLAGSRRS